MIGVRGGGGVLAWIEAVFEMMRATGRQSLASIKLKKIRIAFPFSSLYHSTFMSILIKAGYSGSQLSADLRPVGSPRCSRVTASARVVL